MNRIIKYAFGAFLFSSIFASPSYAVCTNSSGTACVDADGNYDSSSVVDTNTTTATTSTVTRNI